MVNSSNKLPTSTGEPDFFPFTSEIPRPIGSRGWSMRSGRAELLYGSQEICGGVDFVGKIFTEICIYIYVYVVYGIMFLNFMIYVT